MPYYAAGDYYPRGDYYRGDFLGIGSFFKRNVLPFVEGLPGIGPVVKGVEAGVALVQAGRHPNLPAPKAPPSRLQLTPMLQQAGVINIGRGPQTGVLNIETGVDPMIAASLPAGRTMRGFHPNKSTYETRGGGTSRWGPAGTLDIHPKGSVLVRNRRVNVGNARALKRALRRAHGFARLARRVMSFTHPRAGRGHFKFKRRKRA